MELFNEAMAQVMREVDAVGRGAEVRSQLAEFSTGGGMYDALLRGAGPDDGPARPRLQHRLHVRELAEPATHLDGDRERPDDRADDGGLGGPALERPVQVHDVQARGPDRLPPAGHGHRIIGKHRFGLGAPLEQADAAPALDVHGRNDLKSHGVVEHVDAVARALPPTPPYRRRSLT